MKTLREFWRWFDGEDPDSRTAWFKADGNLSPVARSALSWAANIIAEHRNQDHWDEEEQVTQGLDTFPEALRDLSLSLCEALEKMRGRVPEASHAEASGAKAFAHDDGHVHMGTVECYACGLKRESVRHGWPRPVAVGRYPMVYSGCWEHSLQWSEP